MRYLIILVFIFLFMISCSQVERVDNNNKEYHQPTKTILIKLKEPTKEVVKLVSKPILSIKETLNFMERIHIKTVKAFNDNEQTVVQLVHMLRANTYGIRKVWYTHNVFKNDGLLGEENTSTIVITVQTLGKGKYGETFKRQYIKVAEVSSLDINQTSQKYKDIAEEKFFELIKLLVNNEVI